jgi:DNA invertase Pin-like site-specific DNA recombinase
MRSITEQEDDARDVASGNGWRLSEVYVDLTSASRFARKGRPDWERLLADLEGGRFKVLIMWESSRGDRDAETWLGLLRRCRDHRVLIHVVSHERTYDMANHRDWRTLADEGVDSAYESEKTSVRIKRDLASAAVKGRPHGKHLYGYRRVYSQDNGELERVTEFSGQAEVVREIFRRIADGTPLSVLTEDLNERGIPSPAGKVWDRSTVRKIARNPAYAGKRRAGTELYDAMWPAIVLQEIFDAVQDRLNDPARKTTHPGRQKYLLSYLAQCGECGAIVMGYRPRADRRAAAAYGCSSKGRCVYIRMDWVDDYITELTLMRLAQPRLYAAISVTDNSDAHAARAEAQELRARLDAHARMSAAGTIEPRALEIATAELTPKIRAADKRAQAAIPGSLRLFANADEDVRARWAAAPIAARREVIRALFTYIKIVPARAAQVKYHTFDPSRVEYEWRTADRKEG